MAEPQLKENYLINGRFDFTGYHRDVSARAAYHGWPKCHCGKYTNEIPTGDIVQYQCIFGNCAYSKYERGYIRKDKHGTTPPRI